MSTALARQKEHAVAFRRQTTNIATSLLKEWVGEDRAREATGRMNAALTAVTMAARDPSDFYACTPESVANAIAIAALCGIMPGGNASTSLAYVVPRRPRKNEAPQLQYSLSHRGLNAVARRCGQTMVAIPIGQKDDIDVNDAGEAVIISRDLDAPPETYADLRGVVVLVKEIATGNVTCRGWVPKALIEPRRRMSAAGDAGPWGKWPIEMSMKTAMKYAVSRGWCVIDDIESMRAISADDEFDVIDTTAIVQQPKTIAAIAEEMQQPVSMQADEEPAGDGWTIDEVVAALAECDTLDAIETLSKNVSGQKWSAAEKEMLRDNFKAARQVFMEGEADATL